MLPIYNPTELEAPEEPLAVDPQLAKGSLALVYMPWGAASRGSIAIGILKQCAKSIGIEADVHYLNIRFAEKLGFTLYESIANSSAIYPEWFFSCALFGPNGMRLIDNDWGDLLSTKSGGQIARTLAEVTGGSDTQCRQIVTDIIPRFIEECLTTIDWSKYRVVGFSTTFAQTLSSLLIAREIKARHPKIKIVFGGANVDGVMGYEVIKAFDWIDYVVHGEAEQSFPKLLHNILSGRDDEHVPAVSLRSRHGVRPGYQDAQMLTDLNISPEPDYADYMKEAHRAEIHKHLRIKLYFESSRGCWWGAKSHCTFCGLNGNTLTFRKKAPAKVYDEILHISNKYRCLTLNAVDNIMEMDYFNNLLPLLAERDLDLSIFFEVKSNLSKAQVRKLAAAGITTIQPGIESFNTEILRLMRKGVTAIQNIQLLKWCFEYGIDPQWNILCGFPGEHPDQYKYLPQIFRLLFHLRPPAGISPVIFERFSPYHFDREKFKLALTPSPIYRLLFPEQMVDYDMIAYYFEGRWADQQSSHEEYMQPARETYSEWLKYWEERKVFFYYEKGPGFLTIHDNRPLALGAELRLRRLNLNEIQSVVYLFCDENRSFNAIQQMLNDRYHGSPPTVEQTRIMLDQFVERALMFREGDRYLSLAVRRRSEKVRFPNGLKDDA
jgi:ribosomal peptide maturation radical SAM protein 1